MMRRRIPQRLVRAIMVAALMTAGFNPALAASGEDIAHSGKGNDVPACVACHGEQGEGQPDAGYPRLAGLNAGYIEHQLASFADESRRNDIMAPIARNLGAADREALGSYLASLSPPKAASQEAPDQALIGAGQVLAQRGIWSKGVPACAQCHGTSGLGVGGAFPQLAGQSAVYIANQLTAWKSGGRGNDPMHLMKGIASKLDDKQINAVAAYYASLPIGVTAASKASEAKQ
ncbi:MAG: c-type cytochrome [Proteobacteria bacterium]|nr:c-type cytochrome [Pseudomonadota bacterium]